MIVGKNLDGSIVTLSEENGDLRFRLSRSDAWRLQVALQRLLERESDQVDSLREQVEKLKRANAGLRGAVARAQKRATK